MSAVEPDPLAALFAEVENLRKSLKVQPGQNPLQDDTRSKSPRASRLPAWRPSELTVITRCMGIHPSRHPPGGQGPPHECPPGGSEVGEAEGSSPEETRRAAWEPTSIEPLAERILATPWAIDVCNGRRCGPAVFVLRRRVRDISEVCCRLGYRRPIDSVPSGRPGSLCHSYA